MLFRSVSQSRYEQAQQETGQDTSTTTTTTTSPDYQEFVKQVKIIANGPQPTNAEKVGRTYLNTIPYTTIHKLAEVDLICDTHSLDNTKYVVTIYRDDPYFAGLAEYDYGTHKNVIAELTRCSDDTIKWMDTFEISQLKYETNVDYKQFVIKTRWDNYLLAQQLKMLATNTSNKPSKEEISAESI